jgi:hypothetical protein
MIIGLLPAASRESFAVWKCKDYKIHRTTVLEEGGIAVLFL